MEGGWMREAFYAADSDTARREGMKQEAVCGLAGLDAPRILKSEIGKALRGPVDAPERSGQLGA
jgi:hypothetical protein